MPNWCYTDIIIDGPDDEIISLYGEFTKWNDAPRRNELWQFLAHAGLNQVNYRCRGIIDYMNCDMRKNNSHIAIGTETAWIPMIQMWRDIVAKYSKNCKIFFRAEEPGQEIYMTNDTNYEYFSEDYRININIVNPKYQFKNSILQDFNDYGEYSCSTGELLDSFRIEFDNPDANIEWVLNKTKELSDTLNEDDNDEQYIYINEYARDAFLDID